MATVSPAPANPPAMPRSEDQAQVPGARPPSQQRPLPAAEVVGIGAVLQYDKQNRSVRIMDVIPNSPASQAGLTAGLLVQKVDCVSLIGLRLEECVNLMRGPVGSTARLELVDTDHNETNTLELTRQRIQFRP